MSGASRGGYTGKEGYIGRMNCLRQQLLMPGEQMNVRIFGKIKLESLRERDTMRINAQLDTFLTPLRWLDSDYTDYVKEGPDTAKTISTVSGEDNWASYGVGSYKLSHGANMNKFFEQSLLRIYNEFGKWPEDADITSWPANGGVAVPLARAWNRCRYTADPTDSNDYTVSSATNFDVRDLAEIEARFRGAMKREVFSYSRWQELIDNVYNGKGSREVDQVPMHIDSVNMGVNPREIPATDGASLGTWQSLFDFGVDHTIKGIVAPEHCVLTYLLTIRFAPVQEMIHPLASDQLDWFEYTADPEYLASAQPVEVQKREMFQTTSTTSLGYLPAGWQWRCDHDVIGRKVDERDSFPYMLIPGTKEECKDATRIKDAFRSSALGDYMVDLYFTENSEQPIGTAMDSWMSGMVEDTDPGVGATNAETPKTGKVI